MRFLFPLFALILTVVTFQSCKSTKQISANESGMMKADVGEGKVIFMRDCTRCHELKKIESFTTPQWSNILPRMIVQAQLNDTESRQVTTYIEWELEND